MKTVWGLLVVLTATTFGAAYFVREATPRTVLTGPTDPAIPTADVIRGIGFVEPSTEIRCLLFQSAGVIDTCAVQVGQAVRRGDLLMSLRNARQRADLAVAEQEAALARAEREQVLAGINPHRIAAAQRNIESLQSQLDRAQRHFARIHEISQRGAASLDDDDGAESEVARLTAEVRLAEAELEHLKHSVRTTDRAVAEARVALAEARLEAARRELEDTQLTAPFDGVVLEILKREGERAHPTQDDGVLVFADASRLRVRAEVDERYVHRLAAGQPVQISGRGLGQKRFTGRLSLVKQLMGKKTVFTRDSAERKDLDVIQCWIETPDDFHPPLGLQVDIDIEAPAVVATAQ